MLKAEIWIVVGILVLVSGGFLNAQIAKRKTPAAKLKPETKLGWESSSPYTERDRQRVMEIFGQRANSVLSVIRSIQSGARGRMTRKDFELMREDCRRAQAAYPEVNSEELFTGGWVNVDLSAKVPMDFCQSGNSAGTQGKDGKWYLDGGCYVSFVRPQYTKRADTYTVAKYFENQKAKQRADELARLKEDGPFVMMGGSGGSITVSLDKKTNEVVVVRAEEWASKGIEYRIPFILEEWVDIDPYNLEAIKKIPSFAKSTQRQVDVQPSGVRMSLGSMGSQSGTLMPGESSIMTTTVGPKNF